jgi:hypothetical protein
LSFFDYVEGGMSESGTYFVRVKHGASITAGAAVAQHTAGVAIAYLYWFKIADGLEATADLTGETVRLKAIGG